MRYPLVTQRHGHILRGPLPPSPRLLLVPSLSARPSAIAVAPRSPRPGRSRSPTVARTDASGSRRSGPGRGCRGEVEEHATSVRSGDVQRPHLAGRSRDQTALAAAGAARSLARSRAATPAWWLIQELGPGRADGKKGKIKARLRQTESLEKALKSVGAEQVPARPDHLVRRKPGNRTGTQGGRLLYDKSRYRLVTTCKETTGKSTTTPPAASGFRSCPRTERLNGAAARTPSSRTADGPELLRRLGAPRRAAQRQPEQGEALRPAAPGPGRGGLQEGQACNKQGIPDHRRPATSTPGGPRGRQPCPAQLPDRPGLPGRGQGQSTGSTSATRP